jgi:hypothetical protein
MRKNTKITRICNIICAALMLALIICQFMPFWSTAANGDISIQEYTWLPHHNKDLDKEFKANFGKDYGINDVVLMPIVTLVVGALGIIFTVLWSKKCLITVCPVLVGVLATMNYLTNPAFQMNGIWPVHLALSIGLLAASVLPVIQCFLNVIEWFNPEEETVA